MSTKLILLSAISVLALVTSGCSDSGNQLKQPLPGQTPASVNPQAPGYGQAGGPNVPANDPNAKLTPTPSGGTGGNYYGTAGAPLTEPNSPNAAPNSGSTQQKQEKSDYYPNAGAPLTAPTTTGVH